MDPLSIMASTAALSHIAGKIIQLAKEFKDAIEEREDLLIRLSHLRTYLEQLEALCKKALKMKETDDQLFQGLLKLVSESGRLSDSRNMKGEPEFIWEPKANPKALMTQLYVNLTKMEKMLTPQGGMRKRELGQRILWHWDKPKFQDILDTIRNAQDNITSIIDLDQAIMMPEIAVDAKGACVEATGAHVEAKGAHEGIIQLDMKFDGADEKINLKLDQLVLYNKEQRREKEQSEKEAIEQWLTPVNVQDRLATLLEDCFRMSWFAETEQFQSWVHGQPWDLECYGVAGSGKTGLSAMMIEYLQQNYQKADVPVIYLFLDSKAVHDQMLSALFASLLKQLLTLKDSVPTKLKELWRRFKSRRPLLNEVYGILQTELKTYSMVYLIVDALDESPDREELMERLRQLRKSQPPRLSLMVTARREDFEEATEPYCNICHKEGLQVYYRCGACDNGDFDLCEDCKGKENRCTEQFHKLEPYCLPVKVSTPSPELKRYVMSEIGKTENDGSDFHDNRLNSKNRYSSKLQRRLKNHPELFEMIPEKTVQKAEGRFLWVKLYLNSLREKQNFRQIEEALNNAPNVDNLYEEAMHRIRAQREEEDRDLGLRTLALVASARRNLSLKELLQALAIDNGTSEIDEDKDFDMEGILRTTAGLISVDSDGGAVRVDSTLQDYLARTGDKWFPDAELDMAERCVTLLNYKVFSRPSKSDADLEAGQKKYPFLAYASQHWGIHAREAGLNLPSLAGALQLINDRDRVAAYIEAAYATDRGCAGWDVRKDIDGLHVCAWFGLPSFISTLEEEDEEDFDVDVLEETYSQTPLMYACRQGNVEVAEELLKRGASPNIVSARGRTALMEAVLLKQQEMVDFLLKQRPSVLDVNAVHPKELNQTALMLAARRGFDSIVTSILKHPDIKVNQQDLYGQTALFHAGIKGCFNVVQSLLERSELQVDVPDKIAKRSALIVAGQQGKDGVVEVLLQNGAASNFRDDQGGTAMLRATEAGQISTLKIMIRNDFELRCVDEDGRSLMHGASAGGSSDIIRLLHEHQVDVNACDTNGLTPLHEASQKDKCETLEVLLELGADSTLQDRFGRTPLTVAWQYGHIQIMRILERARKDNMQQSDSMSIPSAERLPAWSLAKLGRSDIILGARPREHFLSEKEPGSGYTALHWAVQASQIEVLRLLLQDCHMDPDCTNHYGRTALHLAALYGDLDATTELIRANASLDELDRWEAAPLFLAQDKNRVLVALALIEAGADIDPRKINVQAMFFNAIVEKKAKAVGILLHQGADALEKQDGVPALQVAKNIGDDEIVRILKDTIGTHKGRRTE